MRSSSSYFCLWNIEQHSLGVLQFQVGWTDVDWKCQGFIATWRIVNDLPQVDSSSQPKPFSYCHKRIHRLSVRLGKVADPKRFKVWLINYAFYSLVPQATCKVPHLSVSFNDSLYQMHSNWFIFRGGSALSELLNQDTRPYLISALIRKPEQVQRLEEVGVKCLLFSGLEDLKGIRDASAKHDSWFIHARKHNPCGFDVVSCTRRCFGSWCRLCKGLYWGAQQAPERNRTCRPLYTCMCSIHHCIILDSLSDIYSSDLWCIHARWLAWERGTRGHHISFWSSWRYI